LTTATPINQRFTALCSFMMKATVLLSCKYG